MSEETPEIEETEQKTKAKRPRRRRKADAEATPETPAASSEPAVAEAETAEAESEPAEAEESEVVEEPAAPVASQADEEQEPEAVEEERQPAQRARRPGTAATPAPRRGRRRREAPDITVRAQAKYVRSSARKARLVCDHIRGKSVDEARAILAHAPRAIARDWSKLLESAVANAEHNHELIGEDLYVKAVHADEGPTIKRYRPRALGRATRIRKRTSHLTILLKQKQQ
jgi:ribosomal protein L22